MKMFVSFSYLENNYLRIDNTIINDWPEKISLPLLREIEAGFKGLERVKILNWRPL